MRGTTGSPWLGRALAAILVLTVGATVGLSQPFGVPVAPNDSVVIGRVLGYCVLDSSVLGMTPTRVLYSLVLFVAESIDVANMVNFTKAQVGKVIRAYSRDPIDAGLLNTTIQARVRFEGDELGGNFWIRDIQVLAAPALLEGKGS